MVNFPPVKATALIGKNDIVVDADVVNAGVESVTFNPLIAVTTVPAANAEVVFTECPTLKFVLIAVNTIVFDPVVI